MNGHKSRALRRASKALAAQFPDVHSTKSYQDIVRQTVQEKEVLEGNPVSRLLKRLVGKKPKTKRVERVIGESRQIVLTSGERFIRQRLKKALRRGDIVILPNGVLESVERFDPAGRPLQ